MFSVGCWDLTPFPLTDLRNLTINTKTLTYSDLKNYDNSNSSSFGINLSLGSNPTNPSSPQNSSSARTGSESEGVVPGNLTLSLSLNGSESGSNTKATIGQGTINTNSIIVFNTDKTSLSSTNFSSFGNATSVTTGTINDPLVISNLNRDITQTEQNKKTVLTSDFDASLNIDTRLIVAGAAEIAGSLGVESADAVAANNWNSYSSDTIKGFNITKNAISIPVTTLSTYITNSDYTSQDALYTTAKNYNILYNLAYNPNIKATDLAGEGNLISYNSNQLNQSSDASTAEGFYDRTKDTAAINIDSNTTNSQLAGTLAHEGVHRDFNLSGQSYTNSEEISAHLVGDFTTSAWDSFQSDNTTLRASLPDSNINTNNYANNVVFGELVNPLRDASLVQGMKENYNNFGPRWKNPVTNKSTQTPVEGQTPREHQGNDLAAPKGSIINSAFDGKVTDSRVINGYGNTVVVEGKDPTTGNKIWALYGHMSEPSQLTVGTSVLEGQKIGLVGNTGSSSEGNHLHFGINTGNSSGNIDFKNGWTNPSVKNFGKYENLRDTPAYQKGKSQ